MNRSGSDRRIRRCRQCALPEADLAAMKNALRSGALSPAEDARLLQRYIEGSGMTQSECAAQLGRSQPSVSNRLRLLRLPEDVLTQLDAAGLSERHARALLRLEGEQAQRAALEDFIRQDMSVSRAEEYTENRILLGRTNALSAAEGAYDALFREIDALKHSGRITECALHDEPNGCLVQLRFSRGKKVPEK